MPHKQALIEQVCSQRPQHQLAKLVDASNPDIPISVSSKRVCSKGPQQVLANVLVENGGSFVAVDQALHGLCYRRRHLTSPAQLDSCRNGILLNTQQHIQVCTRRGG